MFQVQLLSPPQRSNSIKQSLHMSVRSVSGWVFPSQLNSSVCPSLPFPSYVSRLFPSTIPNSFNSGMGGLTLKSLIINICRLTALPQIMPPTNLSVLIKDELCYLHTFKDGYRTQRFSKWPQTSRFGTCQKCTLTGPTSK